MRSFRDAILETIRLTLLDMRAGEPAQDPFVYQFSEVTRADTLAPSKMKRLIGNVAPGDEVKGQDVRYAHCMLPVIVEFAFTMNSGDKPASETIEILLADIQRRLYKDRTLNGLAIDTREEGNSVALSSSEDKMIEGTLFLNVHYRHDLDDPRLLGGDGPTIPVAT